MTVSSSQQLQMFIVCIIFGLVSGVLFDILRSIRRIYGGGNIHTTVQDILFLVVYISLSILLCYLYDDGRIRYYQVMGAAFGALVYALLFSHFVMKFFCAIHKLFIKVFIIPIIKSVRMIWFPIKKSSLFFKKKLIKLKKAVKKIYLHKKRIKKRRKLL